MNWSVLPDGLLSWAQIGVPVLLGRRMHSDQGSKPGALPAVSLTA